MRNIIGRICTAVLTLLIASPAIAQDCEAILRGGVFTESVRNSTYDSRDTVMRFACNSSTVSNGGGASAIIYGVPMSANMYRDKVKTSCERYNRDRSVSATDFNFVRDASSVLADAWSNCMGGSGARIGLQQSPDIKNFLVTINYRKSGPASPPRARATLVRVGGDAKCVCAKSVGGSGCTITETGINLTVPDSGTQSLTCTRQSANGILFALDSDIDGQRTASLPSIRLAPAAVITPASRYSSGGHCSYGSSPIPNFEVRVALHDFESVPPMTLSYRGRSSNLGSVIVDPSKPYVRSNVRMMADRTSDRSGLYLTVGAQTTYILKQSGNYDCDYDRGKRQINNLRIETVINNIF